MFNPVQTVRLTESNAVKEKTPADMTKSFGEFLQNALDSVSAQEQNVHAMNDKYLIGQVDVSEVMIASEQAQLSLQLTSQIRNKVVEAYQEIMRMQL
ncbi:flagellar hook-basal body complex protein FliE [Paenibacillus oenotherae]|uniref:Flagellar hook-basal body complex protein FliE n=2 Tax=Paenibacillus oenotherae TaxID=1435645 RepID=A0ABS7D279_9BACL|nr:flagellar hook-basal body complex protein FliE [Paenibacillus oenotherae]